MTFQTDAAYQALHPYFQDRIKQDESLARHSVFGVGGTADLWITVETRHELIRLANMCAEQRWPLLIIGHGSNSLFADAGTRGIVARAAFSSYHIEQQSPESALLIAEAGVSWPRLAYDLIVQGWGNLTFGVGIPGTLGGALVSNAGAHNSEIGEFVEWIEVMDARGANIHEHGYSPCLIRRYLHDELDLGYRYSRFRAKRRAHFDSSGHVVAASHRLIEPPEMVLQLGLRLQRADPEQLHMLLDTYKQERERMDQSSPRRWSVFQDPPGETANVLIARAGLSGMTNGHAQISVGNPNFLVNLDGARASEMVELIEEAHRVVQARFGIDLQLDIDLLGEWEKQGTQP